MLCEQQVWKLHIPKLGAGLLDSPLAEGLDGCCVAGAGQVTPKGEDCVGGPRDAQGLVQLAVRPQHELHEQLQHLQSPACVMLCCSAISVAVPCSLTFPSAFSLLPDACW